MKADQKQVKKVLQTKATYTDLRTCTKLIEEVYSKVKAVSVLTSEVTRSLIPSQRTSTSIQNQETTQGRLQRFLELNK